jgi:hypothetical protein
MNETEAVKLANELQQELTTKVPQYHWCADIRRTEDDHFMHRVSSPWVGDSRIQVETRGFGYVASVVVSDGSNVLSQAGAGRVEDAVELAVQEAANRAREVLELASKMPWEEKNE